MDSGKSLHLLYRPQDPNLAVSAVVPVLAFPSAVSITASSLKNWVGTKVHLPWDPVFSNVCNWVPRR